MVSTQYARVRHGVLVSLAVRAHASWGFPTKCARVMESLYRTGVCAAVRARVSWSFSEEEGREDEASQMWGENEAGNPLQGR